MDLITLLLAILLVPLCWLFYKANQKVEVKKDIVTSDAQACKPSFTLSMELVVSSNSYSSKAKDALLARFKNGQVIADIAEYWDQKLGVSRQSVIDDFLQKHLIEPMPNHKKLEAVFSLSQLKSMCKDIGLKVSGKKSELAERLLLADQRAIEELVSEVDLMWLTEAGSDIVKRYHERVAAEYNLAELQILEHLNDGNLTDAIKVSHLYKSNMLWPSGFDEDFDLNFLSGVLSSPLGNKGERFLAALMHLLPK